MRFFLASLLFALPLSAATLQVDVTRNGFTGPIEIALAPRVEGRLPEFQKTQTLAAKESSLQFADLEPGLYLVLAKGPQPLQRLSAKANAGSGANGVRLTLPKTKTTLAVTLGGQPLPRAVVGFTQDEFRWSTDVPTNDAGHFSGELWEPGAYDAHVRRTATGAPHVVHVTLAAAPLAIDVPDRTITGRVIGDDGKPVGGAQVALRSERRDETLNVRTLTAPDGRFEFFGVREGAHSIFARAPSYLQSDAQSFELRGAPVHQTVDLTLSRGTQRNVRVIDSRGHALANAALFTACDGHVKSTSVTGDAGRGSVALPASASCVVYALPKEGSIGVARVSGRENLEIQVPQGSSSLKLALTSESGVAFADLSLLMRIDGTVVPPAIARQFATHGFSLVTDDKGLVSLDRIPPGTYEFWPYRSQAEGESIYEMAGSFAAPISVNVVTGENDATVKFKARR